MREIVRDAMPPAVYRLLNRVLRKSVGGLSGRFGSWQQALAHGTAYDEAAILERVLEATRKVERGEAVFERDSVTFARADFPFPALAALLRTSLWTGGRLTVLDFGGSLGSSYRQCRSFLSPLHALCWCVVEQPHYVARGKELFETDELRFFETIDGCLAQHTPDIVLFSGVLQYLPDPYLVLQRVVAAGIRALLIDRTPFGAMADDIITLQTVPPHIYPAKLPFRIFAKAHLEGAIGPAYTCIAPFTALDPDMALDGMPVHFGGWLFERNRVAEEGSWLTKS